MQQFSLATSTILTLAGIGLAIFGIAAEEWKQVAVGLVLIFGAGVFATLYLGARRSSRHRAVECSPQCD
jgi:uncharacterized membrane protein YfcA